MKTYTAAVITISDQRSRGEGRDASGPAVAAVLEEAGFSIRHKVVVPDEKDEICAEIIRCADEKKLDLVVTTGGTGFAQRDVTPEATIAAAERLAPGIPEAMRAGSMQITPKACLSREVAGIRGGTLIVNLPGSPKAARENLSFVKDALTHGIDMIRSAGSAGCAENTQPRTDKKQPPSMDEWLREAKAASDSDDAGVYLIHSGVVRATAKRTVREGIPAPAVCGMRFSSDPALVKQAETAVSLMPGVTAVRVWLNEGLLDVGDDIMYVMVGADTRDHAAVALAELTGTLKRSCVQEEEIYREDE